MTATTTIRIEYLPTVELERFAARVKELPAAAATALMIVGAPLLGLAFVITLPIAGIGLAVWMAAKAMARNWTGIARIVKRTALFAAAPFFGLAYLVAFPFVGIGALAYYGVKAARK